MKKKVIDEKIQYELCPRCELNYKIKKQRYCDICNAALRADGDAMLLPEEDEESEKLCPVCKVNYMNPEEDVCFMCQKERETRETSDDDDSWRDFLDDDETEPMEDLEISFDELAKEEEEAEEEEFDGSPVDDFEYVDPDADYGDDEDDDEDEDDDDL